MNYRLRLMLTVMTLFPAALYSEDRESAEVPSIDFLEFLGEWQTSDGEWIDPNELNDEVYAELAEQNEKGQDDE